MDSIKQRTSGALAVKPLSKKEFPPPPSAVLQRRRTVASGPLVEHCSNMELSALTQGGTNRKMRSGTAKGSTQRWIRALLTERTERSPGRLTSALSSQAAAKATLEKSATCSHRAGSAKRTASSLCVSSSPLYTNGCPARTRRAQALPSQRRKSRGRGLASTH